MDREIGTSVARNSTVMLGAQCITWLSSFVLLLFLPRYLGSADYGRLYLAMSMAMILSIVIDFGGNYLIPKVVSRSKEKTSQILMSFIGVRSLLWVVVMGMLVLFSFLVDYSATVQTLIIILGVSKLFEGVVKAIRGCFQGYEMMEYPSIGIIAQKVFIATLAVTALIFGAGSVTVALIMAVGVAVNLVISLKFVPRIIETLPEFKLGISFDLIKTSIPYFLWSVFAVIYYRIDAVMLSIFSTEQVVGWYGGAYRFFDVIMFLPGIFTTVLFPIFSRLTEEEDTRMQATFQKSLKYMLLAGVAMSALFFAFSRDIIGLFYGIDEYGPSVLILQIFAVGIVLVYVDFILGSTILATNRQHMWAGVGFAAILLNVGLNYWMIPYAGQMWGNGGLGAAVATLVTEFFIMVSAFLVLPNQYFKGFTVSIPLKALASGGLLAGLIWFQHQLGIFWIAQIIISLISYLAVCVAFRLITQRELRFIKEFFIKKNFLSFLTTKQEQA